MTNPLYNSQPNYSGVTIQIANPAVYANGSQPQNGHMPACCQPQQNPQVGTYNMARYDGENIPQAYVTNPYVNNQTQMPSSPQGYQQIYQPPMTQQGTAYPPQYYLNNYNYQYNQPNQKDGIGVNDYLNNDKNANNGVNGMNGQNGINNFANPSAVPSFTPSVQTPSELNNTENNLKNNGVEENPIDLNSYREPLKPDAEQDFTKSNNIIANIDDRIAEAKAQKENSSQKNVVALTDEYIKSLENYLNNPSDEIRIMASKEVLKRLDEDKDRKDDAALNALLNKMMQDPSKMVRIAALSAFSSGLATGNDFTVKLLHDIQNDPNADKEDVLQAADILLRFSSDVEVKNIPNPQIKENTTENK